MNRFCLAGMGLLLVAPVAAAQDMPLSQILIDGEDWKLVAEGYKFTEGPAVDRDGNVFFTDQPNNKIWKYSTNGQLSVFLDKTGRANGT